MWIRLEPCVRRRNADLHQCRARALERRGVEVVAADRTLGNDADLSLLDRVELIYNKYVSPLTQYVWRQTLLPVQQAEVLGEGARR